MIDNDVKSIEIEIDKKDGEKKSGNSCRLLNIEWSYKFKNSFFDFGHYPIEESA